MRPPAVRTLAVIFGGSARWVRVVLGLRVVLGTAVGVLAVGMPPAEVASAAIVHAKVTGSEPADGAVVDRVPDAVALSVDAKPATVEGDPLRVYGPNGHRVDDGQTTVGDEGRRLSVGLDRAVDRAAGRYEIVYRIVSADTHLIAGRLSFEARTAVPAVALAQRPGGSERTPVGRLVHGWPEQAWPPIIAGAALGLAAVRLGWQRRRAARLAGTHRPLLPPMQGHLVAGRTAHRPRSQRVRHGRPR